MIMGAWGLGGGSPVHFVAGIDNNAAKYNYNAGRGLYDNAAVIDTGIVADLSTAIEYSAYLYPIGNRNSGYITGVYFGALVRDDAADSFWVRAFLPYIESSNIQARIGSTPTNFHSLANSALAYHTLGLSRENGFCIDGIQKSVMSNSSFGITPRYNIYLGGANLAGRAWRCYRQIITDVKITNNSGTNMHLKPAIVFGEVGMVDVNNSNTFYGSATSVSFTEANIT